MQDMPQSHQDDGTDTGNNAVPDARVSLSSFRRATDDGPSIYWLLTVLPDKVQHVADGIRLR